MAAPSSLASSHLADLHRAGGVSPNTSKRCRPGSSVGAGLLGHGDSGEAVNGVIVRADQPRLAVGGGVAGEEGRILPRLRSTSELVAGDRVLRRDLVTGGHVHRPRLSQWLRSPRQSSLPVPLPSPRKILRRPRPTPELVAGAVSITTQDPPPSMQPCPTPSPVAASSTAELVIGVTAITTSGYLATSNEQVVGKRSIPLGERYTVP
uniref:Uncharacterized protein n=1 Tax=Oryza barthii TaxID=65489 RepID=A0A0D3FEB7_9ORYZ